MKKKIHKLIVENIVSGYGDMDILKGVSINISQATNKLHNDARGKPL